MARLGDNDGNRCTDRVMALHRGHKAALTAFGMAIAATAVILWISPQWLHRDDAGVVVPAADSTAAADGTATNSSASNSITHDTGAATPVASVDTTVSDASPAPPDVTDVPDVIDSSGAPAVSVNSAAPLSSKWLVIPVAGVRADQLVDTYTDARSEGRVHNAIDIMAPQNTPVIAANDGIVVKLFESDKGGLTIYQLDPDGRTVYYYAHLDHYAEGITEGMHVHRGDVIAFVGDTGNAGVGNYHLHFGITIVDDPKHYWGGTDINPYPLLRHQAIAQTNGTVVPGNQ